MDLDKSDVELKQLAIDLAQGRIFTDRDIRDPSMLGVVFMPLIFMDEKLVKELKAEPPGLVYEYLSAAGSRSINGMPCFFSCRMLSKADADKVYEMARRVVEAECKAVGLEAP